MKKIILFPGVHFLFSFIGLIFSVLIATETSAQSGVGTDTTLNTSLIVGMGITQEVYAETLYIGPDAVLNMDGGDLLVYSKYIWIAPTAQISGSGSLIIANPEDNPQYPDMSGTTTIDVNNGLPLTAIIRHRNPNNIILADIADPAYGTLNPTGPLASAFNLASVFMLEVSGGDLLLNGNDFIMWEDGIIAGYAMDRSIITSNSIAGHLIKVNNGNLSFTTFPVGIVEGECTPVSIQGSGDYSVSVTDYAASGITISGPQEGIDRTWHIYGGPATEIYLQHDIATNGTLYNDAAAFITRYLGSGNWSTAAANDYLIDGFHYNAGAIPAGIPLSAADDGAWLSKTSDELSPLPVKLLRLQARKEGHVVALEWSTASEQHCKGFTIERSIDGSNWTPISFVHSLSESGNCNIRSDYSSIDNQPADGRNFYRLKQTDFDGKYTYSKLVSILFDAGIKVSVYPNPVTKYINISGLQYGAGIALYDVAGRLLQQRQAEKDTIHFDMEYFNSGIYTIKITATDGSTTHYKVVKQP